MRRATAARAGVLALLIAPLLAGCAPDPAIAVEQAGRDFDALVKVAAAADESVLRTLEVEDAAEESCGTESDTRRTVYVAAGTFAVQADDGEIADLVDGYYASFADERWRIMPSTPGASQEGWVDTAGITATVTVENGVLVIAVFSPCR